MPEEHQEPNSQPLTGASNAARPGSLEVGVTRLFVAGMVVLGVVALAG